MTDLIDRIRAYVAAIPTHYCMQCSREHACGEKPKCPHCGAKMDPIRFPRNSEADALLREVAALEPVAQYTGDDNEYAYDTIDLFKDIPVKAELYTLTGATHD